MSWQCTGIFLGCGRQFSEEEFAGWDALTQKECDISGLCAKCQDVVFADEDGDWEDDPMFDWGKPFDGRVAGDPGS